MARRTSTVDSNDLTVVKAEKVKVKAEKARDKGKRRAADPEEEVEENGNEQEDEADADEMTASPKGVKRRRVNAEGDSVRSPSPDGDDEPEEEPEPPRAQTLPRDVDGYIPGSIVRVQLHNFLTYDYVEFRPGPYLNMILGPNGTGKSSIACAIALGLNFPPSVLGRAQDINSFVKQGTEKGYIEIELKAPASQSNLTIRRNLSSTSRSSTFTLNGAQVTQTEVKNRVGALNVQVGNLCSFLPQDKVTEFAAMSPQQLLRETQRAAGHEQLTNWHDTLIAEGKNLKTIQEKIQDDEAQMQQTIERNNAIEADVKRYHERKELEGAIDLYNVLLPVAEYRESRVEYLRLKDVQRLASKRFKASIAKNRPLLDLVKRIQDKVAEKEKEANTLKKATSAKVKDLKDKRAKGETLDNECEELSDKIGSAREDERKRLEDIKSLERQIVERKAKLNDRPTDLPDAEVLKEEIKEINLEKAHLRTQLDENTQELKMNLDRQTAAANRQQEVEAEIKRFEDASYRRLNKMQGWDLETYDAIIWLQANKHLFQQEIILTPYLCVKIKDQRYAYAVDAGINSTQLRTFIAQNQEDMNTLNRCINDENVLNRPHGKRARINTWYRPYDPNLLVPPPMSQEEMRRCGFDGYALDYVECSDALRWFLMRECNMHRMAVSLNGRGVDVTTAMEFAGRPIPNFSGGGANFINGTTLNNVTRSRYGRKALSNMTKEIPSKSRNFEDTQTMDPDKKAELDQRSMNARQEYDLAEEEIKRLKATRQDLESCGSGLASREHHVKAQRDKINRERDEVVKLQNNLKTLEQKLKVKRDQPPIDKKLEKWRKELLELNKKRLEIVKDAAVIIQGIVAAHGKATRANLEFLQLKANLVHAERVQREQNAEHVALDRAWKEADAEYQRAKAECKKLLDNSTEALENSDPVTRAKFNVLESARVVWENACKDTREGGHPEPPPGDGVDTRGVEELRAELDTARAKLELNMNTDDGIVRQYERRQEEIAQLERTIAGDKATQARLQKKIDSARKNWKPALDRLVKSIGEKFSAAFASFGCAGEIRIAEHEDYDKWAIELLVKFRESERLQLLTANRQSGGERSLTTIMYLMSLTEEARAPFSLVDEINQGMDQRAERLVHNSLVDVTCKEDSGQYFLITPKLLTDLHYHERMKVLCVNNGEWLPDEKNLGNMNNMINAYLHAKGARAASSA